MRPSSRPRQTCATALRAATRAVVEPLEIRMLLTRFAAIGDFSSDDQIAPTRDVANLVKSWNPEFVITAGDNNYDLGEYETIDPNIGQWYHQFIYPYTGDYGAGPSDNTNHFFPSLGNHDWNPNGDGYNPYLQFFTLPGNERYYSTVQGNVEIFTVNSDEHEPNGTSPTSVQGLWLKNALAASTARWKIVSFHHAPYSSGDPHGNNPFMQWPFQQWGASAVIAGHDHDYERIIKNNFPYFVNGLGGESLEGFGTPVAGSQVRYNSNYGAMLIETTDTSINFKFYNRAGALIDDYTMGTPTPRTSLIAAGTPWKYLDNGTNQGTAWRALSFSDATWASGSSELGYGDGDESTVVGFGGNSGNKFITTYFRKTINIASAAALSDIRLDLLKDDGAVVYINGVEAVRANMPTGTISNTTRASTALGDPDESLFSSYAISSSLFTSGDNVVAVEVHQSDPTSSDLSFNLDLSAVQSQAQTPPAAPTNFAATAASAAQINLSWTDNSNNEAGFRIQRSIDNINFSDLTTTIANVTSYADTGLTSGTRYYYRISATNAAGSSSVLNANALTYAAVSLIPAGDTWKYLDNGTNQGTAWRATSFSDATWKTGPAQIGYGDGDEVTVAGYGPDQDNKYLTTYFRRTFNVTDPSAVAALDLRLLRDDGAVVYLNGTQVHSINMPTSNVTYTSLASNAIGDPEESTFVTTSINKSLLVAGNNTIAVEVHQADSTSSDMSFDLELIASMTSVPAPTVPAAPSNLVTTAASASQINLTWADNSNNETFFRVERSLDNVSFVEIATPTSNTTSYSDTNLSQNTRYYYRVSAVNATGASTFTTANTMTQFAVPLIPAGDTWKYLDNGTNQGTAWRATGFNDTAWATGRAQLGYGDGDEATVVSYGPNANSRFITTYFRRTFSLTDPASITALNMRLIRDDGAVVYLNGTEVYRSNMPTGTISNTTVASTALGDPDESTWLTAAINKSLLVTGNNVIAVEIHQSEATSTDISFDFELIGSSLTAPGPAPTAPTAPTNLTANAPSSSAIDLLWTDNASNETGFKIERSTNGGAFTQIATVGANITAYTDNTVQPLTAYAYRVRATNAAGDSAYSNSANNTTPAAPASTYLSDLTWASSTNGWGPVEKDRSNGSNGTGDGRTITLNGVTYPKGLGVHAASQIVYNLTGGYTQFISDVGIDDETGAGTVIFQVFADGTKIYDSGVMTQTAATKNVTLNIAGVNQLTLTVTNGGDNINNDHADWAGARVVPVSNPNSVNAPTNLSATASGAAINLAWTDNATNETGYKVERSSDNVTFTEIVSLGANVTSYSNSPSAGQIWYYRVRAFNATNNSAYSNKASAAVATNGALPTPLTASDIGAVGPAGSSSYTNGVYTVAGAGADIWDNADAFRFVRQSLTGDGTIIARVASQTNTDEWAKAGIMIRDGTGVGAAHASVFVTPSNGVAFQYRTAANADTDNISASGTIPRWVKLTRAGNIFSSYWSTDGISWTFIGSATITMGSTVQIGLAVTSHNTSSLSTATFDNVSIG